MLQAKKFWNKPTWSMYLSYSCSKAQVPVIPLPPGWSQLYHHIISLKCFTGKLSERLCNLISINQKENKRIKQPLLHILGKQACKIHSLVKFVFTSSKSREIKYLTAAALAKKLDSVSFTNMFCETQRIWPRPGSFPGTTVVVGKHNGRNMINTSEGLENKSSNREASLPWGFLCSRDRHDDSPITLIYAMKSLLNSWAALVTVITIIRYLLNLQPVPRKVTNFWKNILRLFQVQLKNQCAKGRNINF